jgi:hypothetical protein
MSLIILEEEDSSDNNSGSGSSKKKGHDLVSSGNSRESSKCNTSMNKKNTNGNDSLMKRAGEEEEEVISSKINEYLSLIYKIVTQLNNENYSKNEKNDNDELMNNVGKRNCYLNEIFNETPNQIESEWNKELLAADKHLLNEKFISCYTRSHNTMGGREQICFFHHGRKSGWYI